MDLENARAWRLPMLNGDEAFIHVVCDGLPRTICGWEVQNFPHGAYIKAPPTCEVCKSGYLEKQSMKAQAELQLERLRAKRMDAQKTRAQQIQSGRAWAEQRALEVKAWWEKYDEYLESDEWKGRRARVLRRAGHTCEACGVATATQVHHLTYEHLFREPLFDLRAVCVPCHEYLTETDRRRRGALPATYTPVEGKGDHDE